MKKYIVFALICFSVSSAFATASCDHTINVHDNFSIMFQFQALSIDLQDTAFGGDSFGLYFDLVTWAKNVESELLNINEKIFIDLTDIQMRQGQNIIINISRNGIIEETHLIPRGAREELTRSIIAKLNEIYGTNGEYNNLETIELFVRNNDNNIARDMYSGMIYTDFIYTNREGITESIKGRNGYFIETIRVNRTNIDSIITVDSWLCG